jgi:uncharacterized protein with GYD domain
MPYYMVQEVYTPESWAFIVKNPTIQAGPFVDPAVLKKEFEDKGWKLHGSWYVCGDNDAGLLLIVELEDNVDMASMAMMIGAVGTAVKSVKITPLLTIEETKRAALKASTLSIDEKSAKEIGKLRGH